MYRPLVDTEFNSPYASRRLADAYNDDTQILRRRSSPRVELPAQFEDRDQNGQGPFSDAFRLRVSPPPLNTCRASQSHIERLRGKEILDTVPLTPVTYFHPNGPSNATSYSVPSTALPTPAGSPVNRGLLDIHWKSGSSAAGSNDNVYSTSSAPGSKPELGTLDKFTNKWPEPLPLKAISKRSYQDGWELSDADLEKSVDAILLESGIGPGRGMLGLEWFSRWTCFKWCLLFSVLSVLVYGIAGLSCAIGIWFRTWPYADVMYVADNDVLILIILASSILVFAALIGLTGTLLSSRPILAIYALLLWPCFISMCAIGYTAYKRSTFALDQKLDMSWSQYYTPYGRLLIQTSLKCCGWLSPNHGSTPSRTCYPRTPLPGCKGPLLRFEQENLRLVWSTVFSLVPMHVVNIVVAILCANHVTRTFGSGITPKRYRLTARDVQKDAGRILDTMTKRGKLNVQDLGGLRRPAIVRAASSRGFFREDKEDSVGLLDRYSGY